MKKYIVFISALCLLVLLISCATKTQTKSGNETNNSQTVSLNEQETEIKTEKEIVSVPADQNASEQMSQQNSDIPDIINYFLTSRELKEDFISEPDGRYVRDAGVYLITDMVGVDKLSEDYEEIRKILNPDFKSSDSGKGVPADIYFNYLPLVYGAIQYYDIKEEDLTNAAHEYMKKFIEGKIVDFSKVENNPLADRALYLLTDEDIYVLYNSNVEQIRAHFRMPFSYYYGGSCYSCREVLKTWEDATDDFKEGYRRTVIDDLLKTGITYSNYDQDIMQKIFN